MVGLGVVAMTLELLVGAVAGVYLCVVAAAVVAAFVAALLRNGMGVGTPMVVVLLLLLFGATGAVVVVLFMG